MELTPNELADFRERERRLTIKLASRPWPVIRLAGGPLDGLYVKVRPEAARCQFIGICYLSDRTGCHQYIYRREGPGRFVFDELVETARGMKAT